MPKNTKEMMKATIGTPKGGGKYKPTGKKITREQRAKMEQPERRTVPFIPNQLFNRSLIRSRMIPRSKLTAEQLIAVIHIQHTSKALEFARNLRTKKAV